MHVFLSSRVEGMPRLERHAATARPEGPAPTIMGPACHVGDGTEFVGGGEEEVMIDQCTWLIKEVIYVSREMHYFFYEEQF